MNTPLALLAALALPVALVAAAAPAAAAPNENFGRHVSDCAQSMGFSGTHNPGMHRGAAGWTGMQC